MTLIFVDTVFILIVQCLHFMNVNSVTMLHQLFMTILKYQFNFPWGKCSKNVFFGRSFGSLVYKTVVEYEKFNELSSVTSNMAVVNLPHADWGKLLCNTIVHAPNYTDQSTVMTFQFGHFTKTEVNPKGPNLVELIYLGSLALFSITEFVLHLISKSQKKEQSVVEERVPLLQNSSIKNISSLKGFKSLTKNSFLSFPPPVAPPNPTPSTSVMETVTDMSVQQTKMNYDNLNLKNEILASSSGDSRVSNKKKVQNRRILTSHH